MSRGEAGSVKRTMRTPPPRVCHFNFELVSRVYRRDELRAKFKERVKFRKPVPDKRASV
jgi:hypothetical protein